jgi:DNA polymerase III alpha subunit
MAYVKARWPAAFLCARLAERGGFHHPAAYMAEAVRLGLSVRPPQVNYSRREFTLGWEEEQGVLWMGLGQVRDLRSASIRALVKERDARPFSEVRDLVSRVRLQEKEVTHLIQCGALDGLGSSRAAVLAEARRMRRAGSGLQMAFGFAQPQVPPEPAVKRVAWEWRVLGQPVSVHPLEVMKAHSDAWPPLGQCPPQPGAEVQLAAVRLPGWTGDQGFFLGGKATFVMAKCKGELLQPRP